MSHRIESHRELRVFQKSFELGREVFRVGKSFPREEMYSSTVQVRRSSRSVSANIAEAWRERRYERQFCSSLNIAEAEAAEIQVWLEYAIGHEHLSHEVAELLLDGYEQVLRMLVAMINAPDKWCIKPK